MFVLATKPPFSPTNVQPSSNSTARDDFVAMKVSIATTESFLNLSGYTDHSSRLSPLVLHVSSYQFRAR
jgi:hypothetical protein